MSRCLDAGGAGWPSKKDKTIAFLNEIDRDAKEWDAHGRAAGRMYPVKRLKRVRKQLNSEKIELSGLAGELIRVY